MTALRIIGGLLFGGGFAFGFYYGILIIPGWQNAALWTGIVVGAIGLAYGIVAGAMNSYGVRFWSWLGFVLDTSWSMLNTAAGLLIWLPACAIKGNRITPNNDTQRSGCTVYDQNPRGGPYGATTIGTVIGGGWDSHEELHVWQARIFGPIYMPIYGVAWLLNLFGRLVTGKVTDISFQAYLRIVWEDWAYLGGSIGSSKIKWGKWFLGFLLTLLYLGIIALIPIGIIVGLWWLWLIGIAGLLLYSIIRALLPSAN